MKKLILNYKKKIFHFKNKLKICKKIMKKIYQLNNLKVKWKINKNKLKNY